MSPRLLQRQPEGEVGSGTPAASTQSSVVAAATRQLEVEERRWAAQRTRSRSTRRRMSVLLMLLAVVLGMGLLVLLQSLDRLVVREMAEQERAVEIEAARSEGASEYAAILEEMSPQDRQQALRELGPEAGEVLRNMTDREREALRREFSASGAPPAE